MQKQAQTTSQQLDATPNFLAIFCVGAVVVLGMAFLMYYGWLHTPDNPFEMMG